MRAINPITLFSLFGWFWTLLGHGSYRRALPLWFRMQIISLSFLLVFFSSFYIYAFWWRVFHPSVLPDFFILGGMFPPGISFIIVTASVGAAHLEMILGYGMAQRKRQARTSVISATPYLLGIELLS